MIAYDTKSNGQALSSASASWSHTCSGSDRIIFAMVGGQAGSGTAASYNGVSMTQIGSSLNCGGNRNISLWYLINPASGSHTVSVTRSSSSGWTLGYAVSYTGAKQSGVPDATSSTNQGESSSFTETLTTVADNCWVVLAAGSQDDGLSAGTNATTVYANSLEMSFFDNSGYGSISPAGSFGMTIGNSGDTTYSTIMASFEPAEQPA